MKGNPGKEEILREINSLYERYSSLVFRRCLMILRDETAAMDATQDVFLKVLENMKDFRKEASPLTWLYRISTNHCLNILRDKRRRRLKRSMEKEAISASTTHSTFEGPDSLFVKEVMEKVIPLLSDREKRVAIFTYIDGMTREEVAKTMNISIPTVRRCLKRFERTGKRVFGVNPDEK